MATIISISGASASGKTTVAREVLASTPESTMLLSLTTRPKRPSDVPGEYRYVSEEEFTELEKAGSFLWHVSAHGNRYGTLKDSVREACKSGISIAILTIPAAEILADFLQTESPETHFIPIYLRTVDEQTLEQRLRGRGDSEEDITIRMEECRTWNALAKQSRVPFHTIDSGAPQGTMLQDAKEYIRGRLS